MAQAKKKAKAKSKAKPKAKAMKSYLVTYHSGVAAEKKMAKSTPDEMNDMMQKWMDWAEKCGKSLEEMGAPLQKGVHLNSKGKASPSGRKITGYSKLTAESMAGAKKLLKGHPHLTWANGCEIEVHEVRPMG